MSKGPTLLSTLTESYTTTTLKVCPTGLTTWLAYVPCSMIIKWATISRLEEAGNNVTTAGGFLSPTLWLTAQCKNLEHEEVSINCPVPCFLCVDTWNVTCFLYVLLFENMNFPSLCVCTQREIKDKELPIGIKYLHFF